MNISALQLPPPSNWQDFETLCCDLWRVLWKDPNATKNGRAGQVQHGVDISGRPNQGEQWAGLQCKGKDNYSNKQVTEEELLAEVEKAKQFTPALSEWILATSGPKDTAIEELARKITENYLKSGLFSVVVWGWKDILEVLDAAPEVIEKHYPTLRGITKTSARKLDELKETTQRILKEETETRSSLADMQDGIKALSERLENAALPNVDRQAVVIAEYQAELDYSRDLLNSYKYTDCIEYLEKLKNRIWSSAPSIIKFRILTNIGAAKVQLGQPIEAARLFLEAFQYNSQDEKAITNVSLAYLLLGEFENAEHYAKQALAKNPASANAYSFYIQIPIPDASLDSALSKVPPAHRSTPEVAYVLGLIADKEGKSDEMRFWLEKALKADEKNIPDIRGTLGGLILHMVVREQGVVANEQVSGAYMEEIVEAHKLLTDAYERVVGTDLKPRAVLWLLNRSLANRLLGNLPAAIQDIDMAMAIDSSDPRLLKQRAVLAHLNGDSQLAIALLQKLEATKEKPEAQLILADILGTQDKAKEAVEILLEIAENSSTSDNLRTDAKRSLIDAYLKLKDFAKAKAVSDDMRASGPTEILNLTDAAKIARLTGKTDDALSYLNVAREYINEATSYRSLVTVANEFYTLEEFEAAADLYEKLANTNVDSNITRRLLNCYYRFGKLTLALDICTRLRAKYGPLPFITNMESAIYEEIDDFATAKEVCRAYLQIFPDDLEMQLRLAVVNWRNGDFQEVDAFLDSSPKVETLSLNNGIQLADLYSVRGRIQECFATIYELRRRFYENPHSHLEYVKLFFEKAKGSYEWLSPKTIQVDVAVRIEDVGGEKEWYVIEDRDAADFRRREINLAHALAKQLIGKTVGDAVVIKEGLGTERAKVVEIKSKFLYALHETFNVYEKLFPGIGGLWMRHIGEPAEPLAKPEGFQTIVEVVRQRQERGIEIERFYKEGKLTIGSMAGLLNVDPIRVWNSLSVNAEVGVRCCRGNIEESDRAYSLLSSDQPKLVIDLISLLTIHGLRISDIIVRLFGRPLIAQTSIEALHNIIRDRKGFEGGGFITLSKEGDGLVGEEITAEDNARNVEYIENLITWIVENCEVVPVKGALDIPREHKDLLKDMLGAAFLDSVLIATERGRLLYSDDERLRSFAKSDFNVEGVWTQIILMHALNNNAIDRDLYTKSILHLVRAHYYHTSVDAHVLLEAAKDSNWLPSYPYTEVLNTLHGNKADQQSALTAATYFLYELWKQPILSTRRDYLVLSLLDSLAAGRNSATVAIELFKMIKKRFFLLPLEIQRLASLIRVWRQMHPA